MTSGADDLAELIATLIRSRPASAAARGHADALLPDRLSPADRVVGLGWATVDTDRTLADLAAAGGDGGEGLAWEPPTREPAIGASAVVGRVGDIAIVVLEPDTEARMAASLARFGEGVRVVYVEGEGPGGMLRPTALGVTGRLRAHSDPWGPFLIAVERGAGRVG